MNQNIANLYKIADKSERMIIGLMSGTSFDGLDVALCRFTGSGTDTKVEVLKFTTKDYDSEFKEELKSVFAKKSADLEKITLLNEYIATLYARLILESLTEWHIAPAEVDVIASHGQTIFHAPKHQRPADAYPNATLQIGDGDHIAVGTGIITLSDFRQKHIAAGGEGAPLALYGDVLLFADKQRDRVMLNIGGIANFTYLPANNPAGSFSTDVGPGNTLMDQFIQKHYPGKYYDKNAEIARTGTINHELLKALLDHSFFKAVLPKTTGPELFNLPYLDRAISASASHDLKPEDILATLAKFTAQGIINSLQTVGIKAGFDIYVSGGGMYNPLVISYIEEYFSIKLRSTADLGVHPDAKEAVLFALLANEALAGGKTNFGKNKNLPSVSMGKVSFPL